MDKFWHLLKSRLSVKAAVGSGLAVILIFLFWPTDPKKLPEQKLFTSAQLAFNQGNCEKATVYYKVLLEKTPRNKLAVDSIVECQIKLGRTQDAIELLKRFVHLDTDQKYREQLGKLYLQSGQPLLAQEIWPQAYLAPSLPPSKAHGPIQNKSPKRPPKK